MPGLIEVDVPPARAAASAPTLAELGAVAGDVLAHPPAPGHVAAGDQVAAAEAESGLPLADGLSDVDALIARGLVQAAMTRRVRMRCVHVDWPLSPIGPRAVISYVEFLARPKGDDAS